MMKKIAIDKGDRSLGYVEAAKKLGIEYYLVDCLADDIIEQLKDAKALVWHWKHTNYAEKRFARSILNAASKMGISVYPNLNTCETFDDKVAQKYLLEACGLPLVESHIFYTIDAATAFLDNCEYPLVTKLAGGAGSSNVSLIHNKDEGLKVCKKRFDSYYRISSNWGREKSPRQAVRYLIKEGNQRFLGEDKGYIYFQRFLPNNSYDIRVTVIGEKAIIFKRYVRDNDFRASGSGKIDYNVSDEDKEAIAIGFKVAHTLATQTLALDLAYDETKSLKIIEMSYGFVSQAVSAAGAYYSEDGSITKESVCVEKEIISLLSK